jgi:hypothetical protein
VVFNLAEFSWEMNETAGLLSLVQAAQVDKISSVCRNFIFIPFPRNVLFWLTC